MFLSAKEAIWNKLIRFYTNTRNHELAVITSENGRWEGFKKPKQFIRIKPVKIELIYSDDPKFLTDEEEQKAVNEG